MIVVDTNVCVSLTMENAHSVVVDEALVQYDRILAPTLWRSEFLNVMATYVRAGHLTVAEGVRKASLVDSRLESIDVSGEYDAILSLCEQSGCTAYDCQFVFLAQSAGTKLVTFDRKLRMAFPSVAVLPEDLLR